MLVLKIIYNSDLNFVNEIQELRLVLKKKDIKIGVVESVELDNHIIKILCDDNSYNERVKDIINLYISNVLYKVVLNEYKEKEMFGYLTENYYFLKQEEIIEVEEEIMNVFLENKSLNFDNLIYCLNKVNNIIEKIKSCLEENSVMNIDGFIRFRMKELREDIENVIDKVIEGYMVEKEYKEFIKLLKYFVDIQESKIEEINIVIGESGNYSIVDRNKNDIFNEFMKELIECKVDSDVKMEDIIISGLITNSPKRVIIHGRNNCTNKEFMDTIESVFENKVSFCSGCELCAEKQVKL
ncbi:putative sporulation protein YtxC [Clostridium sp. AL.422]|uniref:putative sporulation protein YtxC n=1 Tax=Clostridium TaxID=1485 RepID=UPI00293E0045|nr:MULTISPECIES: putative sporulation protein YtxC [unclassified Clostridium]MDV4150634.1 putative sporulation protein YtxC [Clostridium sp. AL.422]